jgi:membrane protein
VHRLDSRRPPTPRPRGLIGRLIGVAGSAGSRFVAAGCTQHAAGIAYRVLFSLAPLAIVLVSVFGLVLQDDERRERVVDRVIEAIPVDASGEEDVESAIETLATPTSAFGLVSLFVFLWAASGMMSALRRGLGAAMGVAGRRPAARGKLVDFALVAGASVLVLLSVGIGLVAELADELVVQLSAALGIDVGAEGQGIALSLRFLLWIVTALLLYRFVPAAGLRLHDALAGAVVTAVILLALTLATDLVYAKTTDWSLIYGSLTILLVFLYSVYLYAGALLLGAAVAAEWSLPRSSHEEPWRARVRRGFGGLFVRERR